MTGDVLVLVDVNPGRVVQGTGDARYISSRLAPIHMDTLEEQLTQVPAAPNRILHFTVE